LIRRILTPQSIANQGRHNADVTPDDIKKSKCFLVYKLSMETGAS